MLKMLLAPHPPPSLPPVPPPAPYPQQVINHIRAYSGARIILEEGPRRSPHRMLVLTSTEPCHARRCAAFEATIYAVQHLLHDDAPNAPSHVRMVVGREQIGSIMGKAGSTIK